MLDAIFLHLERLTASLLPCKSPRTVCHGSSSEQSPVARVVCNLGPSWHCKVSIPLLYHVSFGNDLFFFFFKVHWWSENIEIYFFLASFIFTICSGKVQLVLSHKDRSRGGCDKCCSFVARHIDYRQSMTSVTRAPSPRSRHTFVHSHTRACWYRWISLS